VLTDIQRQRNEERIGTLEAAAQPTARAIVADLEAQGLKPDVEWGRRDMALQAKLYAARKPGQRVSPPGWSMHEFGLALDIGMLDENGQLIANGSHPAYARLGQVASAHGWSWGGDFSGNKDPDHIEWHPGETSKQAILRLRKGAGLA
jgi:peptidoglycan L-alanyl-D-glutamate endopeptidase CwlK